MIQNRSAAVGWWLALQGREGGGPGDRATLAQLRRCSTALEAMQHRATIDLFRRCKASHHTDMPDVAVAAAVLAHVRTDAPGPSIATALGPSVLDKPSSAILKPVRFMRLIEAETPDERLSAFRRLASMTKGQLNVSDLVNALLGWTEFTRRRWIFDYWNAGALDEAGHPSPATEVPAS